MTARCPHGSPWFVECWPCADEVIAEHDSKIVNIHSSAVRVDDWWPRECGERPTFDGVPFFSSTPGTSTPMPEPEFLTPASFIRARTQWFRTLFGRHLAVVAKEPPKT